MLFFTFLGVLLFLSCPAVSMTPCHFLSSPCFTPCYFSHVMLFLSSPAVSLMSYFFHPVVLCPAISLLTCCFSLCPSCTVVSLMSPCFSHILLFLSFFLAISLKSYQEKDKKYMLALESLKLRDLESGLFSRHPIFALFNADNR